MRFKFSLIFVVVLIFGAIFTSIKVSAVSDDLLSAMSTNLNSLQTLPAVVSAVTVPELETPAWLEAQIAAELASQRASIVSGADRTVTYDVATRGDITADYTEFKTLANQTLNDVRGWSRLGINFREVASDGDFTLVLSEASQVPTFSSVCSTSWSCRVGRYVVINQDRWLYASDAWTGSLRDYRNMVVNHETGHWLGHYDDNAHCSGSGASAPLMQQQSINLLGCSFNPWSLDFELWSSTLGIY